MPPPNLLQQLADMEGTRFERLFLSIMLRHHEGAIVMCNHILQQAYDPRTALLAVSIHHSQVQQMEQMRRLLRARSEAGAATVPYPW